MLPLILTPYPQWFPRLTIRRTWQCRTNGSLPSPSQPEETTSAFKVEKVGFRSTTPDYLPVVGPVIDKARFLTDFAPLRKNAKHPFTQPPPFLEGLYVTAGHGSRGLITCPLAGELLASIINHEPAPVPVDLIHDLNPSRFLVRDLSRNKI